MKICKNCKYYLTCGDDTRTQPCQGKEVSLMSRTDFYDIAVYGNENWKGNYSAEEIKDNADIYYSDFIWSKENNKVAPSIQSLCRNLADDVRETGLSQPKEWLCHIISELYSQETQQNYKM